jgi:hypothetical protein
MTHPFTGVTVLDLTQIYNGPYATFLLAQGGADVIKIEPPGGEHLRKRQGASGAAMPFAMLNANKKTMTLNLKSPQGREVLLKLVPQADVLVENFAPGVMERLDLGIDVLHAANPRLICAAGSGYGRTGPYRDFPAMDLTVQAMTGVIGLNSARVCSVKPPEEQSITLTPAFLNSRESTKVSSTFQPPIAPSTTETRLSDSRCCDRLLLVRTYSDSTWVGELVDAEPGKRGNAFCR